MLMRKIRDDQKSLSRLRYEFYPKRCKDWSDCKKDECCIRQSKTKGFCKKRPQRGDRCKPLLLPGLGDCPCDRGLTCTRYRTTKHGKKKHRCEHLRVPTDEVDHRYVWFHWIAKDNSPWVQQVKKPHAVAQVQWKGKTITESFEHLPEFPPSKVTGYHKLFSFLQLRGEGVSIFEHFSNYAFI